MPGYVFPLTHIFLYKDRIYDQRKPIFWNILRSENLTLRNTSEQLVSNENIDVSLHFSDFQCNKEGNNNNNNNNNNTNTNNKKNNSNNGTY